MEPGGGEPRLMPTTIIRPMTPATRPRRASSPAAPAPAARTGAAGPGRHTGARYNPPVDPADFDEAAFCRAIEASGAKALLIGRRALVVLGLPVLTADYDFWVAAGDIEAFNQALKPFALQPTRPPAEARRLGRYALENDERVDVLVASTVVARSGEHVAFADVWARRRPTPLGEGVTVALPCLDDLILTKRFALRPKDLEDIRLLEIIRGDLP